jgi:hypothetical protein
MMIERQAYPETLLDPHVAKRLRTMSVHLGVPLLFRFQGVPRPAFNDPWLAAIVGVLTPPRIQT